MATTLGTYFLDTVEQYGIDEIRYYHVDESFHAHGDTWAAEHAKARKDDFYDVDTRLGELVNKIIPEVFFDRQPQLKEDAKPEPNVDGKWIVYIDADSDDYFDVDPTENNIVFKEVK